MPTFNTPEPISAVLDIPAGRVQFTAADRTDTTAEVLPADPSKDRDVKVAEEAALKNAEGAAAELTIQATTTVGDIVARSL